MRDIFLLFYSSNLVYSHSISFTIVLITLFTSLISVVLIIWFSFNSSPQIFTFNPSEPLRLVYAKNTGKQVHRGLSHSPYILNYKEKKNKQMTFNFRINDIFFFWCKGNSINHIKTVHRKFRPAGFKPNSANASFTSIKPPSQKGTEWRSNHLQHYLGTSKIN